MKNIFRETHKKFELCTMKNIDFPPHIHDGIELVYVKNGSATALCDGREYRLSRGDYFIAFPNQVHSYQASVQGEYILLIILPSYLLRYKGVFYEGFPTLSVTTPSDSSLDYLIGQALAEYKADGYSGIIEAYLTAFFGKLIKNYDIEKSRLPRDSVFKILEYCGAHYCENITVDDVAATLGYSRSHISHIFSNRLNIGFCEYINTLRLNDAKQLLSTKSYTVTEISDMAGFPTVRTFNRAFRAAYGISPSEYRKNGLNKSDC